MVTATSGAFEWKLVEHDRAAAQTLAQQLELHPAVARILHQRGARDAASVRRFLEPSVTYFCDPFDLSGMRDAVERLHAARAAGETVLVFGDYDVDGIAGTALLVRALRRFGITRCMYATPDRLVEGYGIRPEHVDRAKAAGASLIVTVDNGTAAHDAIDRCRELGIDIIVTDHHQINGPLPNALVVVNPRREPETHPAAHLCGAGVALKLARALTGEWNDLDLAALGTIADVVPLVGENRDIVALGLRQATSDPRPGLLALAEVSKVSITALRSDDVAYQLAPRINAGGRVADAMAGLELLLCESSAEARELARRLDEANQERKAIENQTLAEALEMIDSGMCDGRCTIVLASNEWHPGVIGIVASRIQSVHYRPVVLIAVNGDGTGRGSARSVDGFDIGAAIDGCRHLLEGCGGHTMAAGLTIRSERVAAFVDAFEAIARLTFVSGPARRILRIDAQVGLTEVDGRLVRTLDQLQPFGQGNPAPVFCCFNVQAPVDSWRELRGGHLKFYAKEGGRIVDVIGFRMAERAAALASAPALDIAFSPQLNTWRGETTVQLVLKDIRVAGNT